MRSCLEVLAGIWRVFRQGRCVSRFVEVAISEALQAPKMCHEHLDSARSSRSSNGETSPSTLQLSRLPLRFSLTEGLGRTRMSEQFPNFDPSRVDTCCDDELACDGSQEEQ